ncbi:YiiX family permuted papain-like enzyme [Flavobacteriaceae bacterium]|nr:YiiX family permuted papain-like enzyme [Flavobacteriaceae bacterium]
MKKILLTILTIGILAFLAYWGTEMYQFADGVKKDAVRLENFKLEQKLKNGDIIFQTSKSSQSKAIQLATNSKYSHMGIIYENDGQFFVYEAVQPVKLTPLIDWINRGENGHYVIKRLENADQVLTSSTLTKMKQIGEQFKGKPYDIYFEWSDDKIYCSELVWKMYKQATNIEIGQLEQLSDFDLSNEIVKAKMKERYGNNIPMDEKVISPAAMFNSDKLITIEEK